MTPAEITIISVGAAALIGLALLAPRLGGHRRGGDSSGSVYAGGDAGSGKGTREHDGSGDSDGGGDGGGGGGGD